MAFHPWSTIINKTDVFEFRLGLTSFVNPYSMLVLEKEPEVCEAIDYWCLDGISLVKLFEITFKRNYHRLSFDETSLAPKVFQFARKNELKIAIVGTEERFIHSAIKNIEKLHEVEITYYRNGYFKSISEVSECLNRIIQTEIDVVIAGMGTPHQEKFLIALKERGWSGYGFTCGGYLHQSLKEQKYYPTIFDKLNIRWLYRIIDEPKLFSRYFLNYPLFLFRFFIYLFKIRLHKVKNLF